MLTIIAYRLPQAAGAASVALRALLWSVVLIITLALALAAVVALWPYLAQLVAAGFVIVGYACLTYPRSKGVCK